MNDRLRTAILRSGLTTADLATRAQVDTKTVDRWVAGRRPHARSRAIVATILSEDEAHLWPDTRPDQAPGSPATAEILGAYAHRADIPQGLWTALLTGARERVDLVGYAFPFLLELTPSAVRDLVERCADGLRIRLAVADPDCEHVMERDGMEQLGGTLPGRIRNALAFCRPLLAVEGAQVGLHQVHLYSSIFRFDDQMIVTPYGYRMRGHQHPALHLRLLSPHGLFATYAAQFEDVWATTRSWEGGA